MACVMESIDGVQNNKTPNTVENVEDVVVQNGVQQQDEEMTIEANVQQTDGVDPSAAEDESAADRKPVNNNPVNNDDNRTNTSSDPNGTTTTLTAQISTRSSKRTTASRHAKLSADGDVHCGRKKRSVDVDSEPCLVSANMDTEDVNNTQLSPTSNHSSTGNEIDPENDPKSIVYKYIQTWHRYYNPVRQHFWIHELVEKRNSRLLPINPKLPEGFDQFLINRHTYMLRGKPVPERFARLKVPSCLPTSGALFNLFMEQEDKRYKMRLQHQIEKERMQITKESGIIRLYKDAAKYQPNQSLPLSACTYLNSVEVYNPSNLSVDPQVDNVIISKIKEEDPRFVNEGPSSMSGMARLKYTNRILNQSVQSLEDKWNETKRIMFNRQIMEAQALHAVQKMNWLAKMNDIGDRSVFEDSFVPMVEVTDTV